jgi:hypothetical protein
MLNVIMKIKEAVLKMFKSGVSEGEGRNRCYDINLLS